MIVKLLTLNIWSLPVGFSQSRRWRLEKIAEEIQKQDPDIVFLQECWLSRDVKKIGRILHKYSAVLPTSFINYGGLAVFSKTALTAQKMEYFHTCTEYSAIEMLAHKGVIVCQVKNLPVLFLNTHLYAGCSAKNRAIQRMQVQEILQHINNIPNDIRVVIGGDFNLPPELLMQYTKNSLVSLARLSDPTFDPRNKYTQRRGNWLAQPQYRRLDYFVTRTCNASRIQVLEEQYICKHPPLSDHYGVLLTMKIT